MEWARKAYQLIPPYLVTPLLDTPEEGFSRVGLLCLVSPEAALGVPVHSYGVATLVTALALFLIVSGGLTLAVARRCKAHAVSFPKRWAIAISAAELAWVTPILLSPLASLIVWYIGVDREGDQRPLLSGFFPTLAQIASWAVVCEGAWMLAAWRRIPSCIANRFRINETGRSSLCHRCGYDVHSVHLCKCPECGTELPGRGSATAIDLSTRPLRRARIAALVGGIVIAMLSGLALSERSRAWLFLQPWAPPVLVIADHIPFGSIKRVDTALGTWWIVLREMSGEGTARRHCQIAWVFARSQGEYLPGSAEVSGYDAGPMTLPGAPVGFAAVQPIRDSKDMMLLLPVPIIRKAPPGAADNIDAIVSRMLGSV